MPYNYREQRPWIFTEEGTAAVLRAHTKATELIELAGAVRADKLFVTGEAWNSLAVIDYLVEIGHLRRATSEHSTFGQHQVFVSGKGS